MIGKVLRGTNAGRLLSYLYGPGKANEHADPHLVAAFGDPAELEPERRPGCPPDLRRLTGLLNQPLAALAGDGYAKPVWHCATRAAPEDRVLTDAEWAHVAAQIMDRTGLAPDGDERGVRWVAVRHAPDHIHLVATLARQDGTRPRVWNDYFRVREVCQEMERRFGLRVTAPADRTAARRATRAEAERAARQGWEEAPRVRLRREVCAAAAGASTECEFFTLLGHAGVLVRHRHSSIKVGEVTGYAVGLASHTAKDGGVIWYGGGKLAPDLTLPTLRRRWGPAPAGPAGWAEVAPSAARAFLRNMVIRAAERSPDEAAFFARLREAGVQVRLRYSELDPEQVTGYAVTLPSHTGPDGTPLWYGGGRLAAGLTLPRLRDRWNGARGTAVERSGSFRFTAPERDAIYTHAARQAVAAAEHIRRCAHRDPAAAADAAWAAADTLHIAARALRSRQLRRAADAYDRAARPPHRRIPHRSGDGERLRRTARIIAISGDATPDSSLTATALVASLVTLTAAVAELRQIQQHAAQAAAARTAAEQLRTAEVNARSRPLHSGWACPHMPEAGNGAAPARHDFPASPALSPPLPDSAERPDQPNRQRRRPLPPRRAGPARQ